MEVIHVQSPDVQYTEEYIEAHYRYQTVDVVSLSSEVKDVSHSKTEVNKAKGDENTDISTLTCTDGDKKIKMAPTLLAAPRDIMYTFRTKRKVPRLGVMLVGWGGNNGSTVTAMLLANKLGLEWPTKEGVQKANYYGSITQAGTVFVGVEGAKVVHAPLFSLLPMVNPNEIVLDGWDISALNLADAMERACVLDYNLQKQLRPHMESLKPRKSIYYQDFRAANQNDRADNVFDGDEKGKHLEHLRQDIRDFKQSKNVDEVIVLWTANTERFCDIREGLNDTADNLLDSIKRSDPEVSPSTLFAVAAVLEGCSYINGSPQNTFVPGLLELAKRQRTYIGGDDFKSGQTKFKSAMVDFLISAGIKPRSIVSYNHLGNNDGKNLSSPEQFRSKEISKSNVVDDMVESNRLLFQPGEYPDHCVVIKYVPNVGDSKRAMDEYICEISMGGRQSIVVHNTCEDSLLACSIIVDLVVLTELFQRITFRVDDEKDFQRFNSVLSVLSYLCKAPLVEQGAPLVNSLFRQRACIENVIRACAGLPPTNHMLLEFKHENLIKDASNGKPSSHEVVGHHEAKGTEAADEKHVEEEKGKKHDYIERMKDVGQSLLSRLKDEGN